MTSQPKAKTETLKSGELSTFCYQMSLVLKSGIPLTEGIQLLQDEIMEPRLKTALDAIYNDVKKGSLLNLALDKHEIFPEYMIRMVSIGETSGNLDDVMTHLSLYYEKNEKLNRRIMSAITYPLILAGLMAGVILLLILKVLPMFNDILNSIGGEMPAVTRVMMNISLTMRQYLLVIVVVLLAIGIALFFFLRSSKGQGSFDKFKIEFSLTKNIYQKIAAARFSMGMSLLLKSGMGFEEAMDMVQEIIGNKYVSEKIKQCKQMIQKGTDTSTAFQSIGIFPKLFVRMLSIGHKTGELDNMMSRVSTIYDNEVDNTLARATAAIEPILVIILSVVVGIILLTVMLPLISIMSSIG